MLITLLSVAMQAPVAAVAPVSDQSSEFALVDSRSPQERKGKNMNAWMFNCNVGVIWIGDNGLGKQRIGGDRFSKLQRSLTTNLGDKLRGHRLDVTKYSFVINGAVNAQQMGVDLATGWTAPGGHPTIQPKCSKEKMAAGWFAPSELTNANTPLIAVLEGTFDGKPIAVRSVKSPKTQLTIDVYVIPYKFMDAAEFDGVLDDIGTQLARTIAPLVN